MKGKTNAHIHSEKGKSKHFFFFFPESDKTRLIRHFRRQSCVLLLSFSLLKKSGDLKTDRNRKISKQKLLSISSRRTVLSQS